MICPKLTMKVPERHYWYLRCLDVCVVDFEQVNASGC